MEFGKEYIKVFDTEEQYLAFKASSGYNEPNVSYVSGDSIVHYNPIGPCSSEKVKTTYEWVEIGGVKWATKNVGALTVSDYGQKFSWGETKGYTHDQISGTCHSKSFTWADYELANGSSSNLTKYNSTDGKTVLEAEDDAATVNMGSGWRMPTIEEFEALETATTSAWTSSYEGSGVAGLVLTSKADSNVKLFFPAAGSSSNGSVNSVGIAGDYWSSSISTLGKAFACSLDFDRSNVYWQNSDIRCYARAVRGLLVN